MNSTTLAIPVNGKMALRSFHSQQLSEAFQDNDFEPVYFLGPHYFSLCDKDTPRYRELKVNEYKEAVRRKRLFFGLTQRVRRFGVRTETTDLRFRDNVDEGLFVSSLTRTWMSAALFDILRHIPGTAQLACWLENHTNHISAHRKALHDAGARCVLTPSMGSHTFEYEGFFAKEAQRMGLPVFAAITNYDNIVNRGYRGYAPECVAVWSKLMADETMKLQNLPASRIEITGPAQFDHYFHPLRLSREDFLKGYGLDPAKKTILFAGGVNITRYFEIYRLFVEPGVSDLPSQCNLVIRPYPHVKLLSSPGWKVLDKLLRESPGVYVSLPPANTGEDTTRANLSNDLSRDAEIEELHGLLRYSDVMINIYSTISLEAAICDLPVIHMGYDLYTFGHKFFVTTGFQQRQTHNRRKLRLAASRVAKDEADLVSWLRKYLQDPTMDREQRLEYALSECEYLDGKSSQRLAAMLADRMARRRSS